MDPEAENLAFWNERASFHLETEMYQGFVKKLRGGGDALLPLEASELGDIEGLRTLHLQCHVGTDTLSLARRGAVVTGVDFSPVAIDKARELSIELGIEADFVCSGLADLPASFTSGFDLVFTSYGVVCWLPDLDSWAETIARCLKRGGRFYIVDSHPLAYGMPQDMQLGGDELTLRYPYLCQAKAARFDEHGSYADPDAPTEHNQLHEWSHGLGEIVTAVTGAGLRLEYLREHRQGYFPVVDGMVKGEDGHWRLPGALGKKYPLTFSLSARKQA